MLSIFGGISLFVALISVVSPQMLPDSQALTLNELERLYLDNAGPAGFKSGIEPCTQYIDSTTARPNNTLGRQSAAQWIRTAFRKATFLQCSQPV
jgi:hypothetical protein